MRNLIVLLALLPGIAAAQGTLISPRALRSSSCDVPGHCAVKPEIEPAKPMQSCAGPRHCSLLKDAIRANGPDDEAPVLCLTAGEKAGHTIVTGFVGGMIGLGYDTLVGSPESITVYAAVLGLVVGRAQADSKPTCPFRRRIS
jgi:hypothetical protein